MERAIGLPISTREPWRRSWSLRFLLRVQPRLDELGYKLCLGFRDKMLTYAGIGKDLINFAGDHGILWYWHPPFNTAFGIGKTGKLTDHLKAVGDSAGGLAERGMQYLLLHPDAAQYNESPPVFSSRFLSRVSASQMMRFLQNHIDPGRELAAVCQLLWENVHDCLFHKLPDRYMVYYAAQAGYLETRWLADLTLADVAFDSEHYYGSLQFHLRWGLYQNLPIPPKRFMRDGVEMAERLLGYWLVRGYAPFQSDTVTLPWVIREFRPKIFHLGGGTSLLNERDQATTHIHFDLRQRSQRQILLHQVAFVEENGGWLEAENEGRERDSGYSSRITSDRQAKKRCFWQVVEAIEKYRAGTWRPDPKFVI